MIPTTCPACAFMPLADAGETLEGHLRRCVSCGSWTLAPRVDTDSVPPEDYGREYRSGLDPHKAKRLVDILTRNGPRPTPERRHLLDVGSGAGEFLTLAQQEGWTALGLDPDPCAVAEARRRGVETMLGPADARAPVPGTFDVITLWDVIEHLPAPEPTLRWLATKARAGGTLLIVTPNAESTLDRLAAWERRITGDRSQRLLTLCLNRYHLQRFTATGLTRLLARTQFRVDHLQTLQLFSLRPARYLAGFAPGITGWTGIPGLDRTLSRAAFGALRLAHIHNKLLCVATRTADALDPPA